MVLVNIAGPPGIGWQGGREHRSPFAFSAVCASPPLHLGGCLFACPHPAQRHKSPPIVNNTRRMLISVRRGRARSRTLAHSSGIHTNTTYRPRVPGSFSRNALSHTGIRVWFNTADISIPALLAYFNVCAQFMYRTRKLHATDDPKLHVDPCGVVVAPRKFADFRKR